MILHFVISILSEYKNKPDFFFTACRRQSSPLLDGRWKRNSFRPLTSHQAFTNPLHVVII
jgi:hypothetical protein